MRLIRSLLFFLALSLATCTPSRARISPVQTAADPTVKRGDLEDMLLSLQLDALIARATKSLAATAAATAMSAHDLWLLHYYRGSAYWRIGLLDEAESDMAAIAPDDPDGIETRRSPQWYLTTIALQKKYRPAHRHDLVIPGKALFAVYSDEDDETLRRLWDLLPVAVNSVAHMTGSPPRPTAILVFSTISQMQGYEDIPRRTAPIPVSILAHGGLYGVHIAPLRLEGRYTDPRSGFFRLTITHEYLHVIVARILETQNDLPIWLAEGLANAAGCLSAPGEEAEYARRFQAAVQANAVLSYDQISDGRAFNQIADEQFAGKRHEDPYAQATEMTKYLMLGRAPDVMARLLATLHEDDDFAEAFRRTFGESPKDFYNEWHTYATR